MVPEVRVSGARDGPLTFRVFRTVTPVEAYLELRACSITRRASRPSRRRGSPDAQPIPVGDVCARTVGLQLGAKRMLSVRGLLLQAHRLSVRIIALIIRLALLPLVGAASIRVDLASAVLLLR